MKIPIVLLVCLQLAVAADLVCAQTTGDPAPGSAAGAPSAQDKAPARAGDDQVVPKVEETVTVTGRAPAETLSLDRPATTASRLGIPVRDLPASVTVVDRGAIEERGASDTQDVLASVPGMTAAAPPGSAGSVSYRGFGASQLTQLFNGITVQYDAVAARPVDSWIYDRVEVIGGPSTFLFGAGAVGGSINYITKIADAAANVGRARASYGSYGTWELAGGVNRRLGGGRVRNTVRADVSRTGSDSHVEGNERSALTGALSLRTDAGSRFSHTAAVEYQHERVERPYWGTPLLNPTTGEGRIDPATRFTNYNTRDGLYEQEVVWARSIAEYRLGTASIRNTLYHYDGLRDYRNVEVYRYTATNTSVTRSSPLLQRHDQVLTGNRVEAQHAVRLGRLDTAWSAGFDVSANQQTRFPRSLTLTVSTVDPVRFTTESFFEIPGMLPGFVPDRTNDVSTFALFAENRTTLVRGLSVVTGLRHDRIDLEVTNHRVVTATDPAYFKRTYRPTTGRVGLTYALRPAVNVYTQYSTAADPPAGILTTANFSQVRDFDLTTGRQVEVGSKFDLPDGRGAATLALYHIVRKNLAIADPANPGTTIPVGRQSSRGVELAVSLRATRALAVQGNYAWTDAHYDDFIENVSGVGVSRAGNVPGNTPRGVGNVWATYSLGGAWQMGVDGRWVGRRYGNTANTIHDGAYSLYGAFVSWRPSSAVVVTARGRNLTDERYARSVTGTPMYFLGAPRTFDVSLGVSF